AWRGGGCRGPAVRWAGGGGGGVGWADDPHQTAQRCRAPISVSACSSPATAMRRSLTLPLEHVSHSYRYKCVHVAHLGALNIRKNTSRQPVERHIRLTSSQSPTFSILRAIQNT